MRHRSARLNESGDLVLRSPPECLFTLFFSLLAAMHGVIALLALLNGRWEAYLSAAFCIVFSGVAIVCRSCRQEITIDRGHRELFVRTGVGPVCMQRRIAFDAISGVRLTMLGGNSPDSTSVELICDDDDDLRCPASSQPRQQALLLAMMLGVPLTKVYGERLALDREGVDAVT